MSGDRAIESCPQGGGGIRRGQFGARCPGTNETEDLIKDATATGPWIAPPIAWPGYISTGEVRLLKTGDNTTSLACRRRAMDHVALALWPQGHG